MLTLTATTKHLKYNDGHTYTDEDIQVLLNRLLFS